jgi:hypothetical protein
MPLLIRDNRAVWLARQLAARRGMAISQAVIWALENALAQGDRPLRERIADIARDASRLSRGKHGRAIKKHEIDDLWGN